MDSCPGSPTRSARRLRASSLADQAAGSKCATNAARPNDHSTSIASSTYLSSEQQLRGSVCAENLDASIAASGGTAAACSGRPLAYGSWEARDARTVRVADACRSVAGSGVRQ